MNHIAFLLRDIHFRKKTGKLTFKKDRAVRYFFFQDGELIQVKTNVPEERLGEILFKTQRLSQDAYAKLDDFIELNMSLGQALKKRGVVSEHDLEEALAFQVRETILNCFPHFDAEITFLEHEKFSEKPDKPKTNIPFLIEYGIRRIPETEPLQRFLAAKVPVQRSKALAYLLTEEEKKLLELFQGQDKAEFTLRTSEFAPDFFWKSLYLFYCLEIVEFKGAEEKTGKGTAAGKAAAGNETANEKPADVAEVHALRYTLSSRNYYQLLGVGRDAREDDIKKAYFRLARRFHPDRFPRDLPKESRAMIEEVFSAMTVAYRTLMDKDKRAAYNEKAAPVEVKAETQDVFQKADIKFRQGRTLYNQGRYPEAVALLEESVRMRKDKGDYFLLLAMAESKLPGYSRKAEEDFLKALQLEPWNPEGYVGLGMLYKQEGLKVKALTQFKKALEVDPEHSTAREQVVELSGGEKKGLKDFFSFSFFGSGKKPKK